MYDYNFPEQKYTSLYVKHMKEIKHHIYLLVLLIFSFLLLVLHFVLLASRDLKKRIETLQQSCRNYQKELDLEHTRYIEEHGKRGDLQVENEELREELKISKQASIYGDKCIELEKQLETSGKVDDEFYKELIDKYVDEVQQLKKQISDMKQNYVAPEDVNDWIKSGGQVIINYDEYEDTQEIIKKLKEQNEELKEEMKISAEQVSIYGDKCLKVEKQVEELKKELEWWKNKDVRNEIQKSKILQKNVKNIKRDANQISVVMMNICKHYTELYSE